MSASDVTITINGRPLSIPAGMLLSAAIARTGARRVQAPAPGEDRLPLCGMGICFGCCVTINNQPYRRSCQVLCEEGMEVLIED